MGLTPRKREIHIWTTDTLREVRNECSDVTCSSGYCLDEDRRECEKDNICQEAMGITTPFVMFKKCRKVRVQVYVFATTVKRRAKKNVRKPRRPDGEGKRPARKK